VDVSGVPGQEDAAGPVARGLAMLEAEVGRPDRITQAQGAAGEAVADRLQLRQRRLVRLDLAVTSGGGRWPHALHSPGRRRAEREEEQHSLGAQEGVRCARLELSVDLQVGQRERLRVGAALEGDSCRPPDGAVSTVAADQVPGAYVLGCAILAAQCAGDLVGADREREQLDAAFDLEAVGDEDLVQDRLGLGLRDEQQERVSGVFEPDVEEPHRDEPRAEM
jgi:hypothetical protein